jgi:hypothetical protein
MDLKNTQPPVPPTPNPDAKDPKAQAQVSGQPPAGQPVPQGTPEDKAAVQDVEKSQKEKDPDFASKFAALTREQKKLFEDRQKFKHRLAMADEYEQKSSLFKNDPLAFLEKEGLTLEDLVKRAASQGQPPSTDDKVQTLEQRIESLVKEREEEKKRRQDDELQKEIADYKGKIKEHLSKDPEKFEAIMAFDAIDTVYEVILQHYNQNQEAIDEGLMKPLTLDQAALAVEEDLLETAKKYSGLKKLQSKVEVKEEPRAEVPPSQVQEPKKTVSLPDTLTPKTAADPIPAQKPPLLDRDESIRQIAEQLKEKMRLKKLQQQNKS